MKLRLKARPQQKRERKGEGRPLCFRRRLYSMLCCVPHRKCACHESVKGYKNDPGMDHWTAVKIVLGVNKDMFLDYGGDKEFGVKGYVDASFGTDPDDSKISIWIHIESGSN